MSRDRDEWHLRDVRDIALTAGVAAALVFFMLGGGVITAFILGAAIWKAVEIWRR